jgi:hypothetical protein
MPYQENCLAVKPEDDLFIRNKADYADFSIIFIPCEILAVLSPWNISSEKLQGITPHPLCR